MSDPMQEIMASFFVECEELHESLVDALQSMADGEGDVETINVAFRAVHSIKGGAGAFGLDALVDFSHQFETVMDACRSGTLAVDDRLNELFLRCSDMLSDLIRCSRDGEAIDEATAEGLIAELATFAPQEEEAPAEEIEFQPMTLSLDDLGAPGDAPDLPPLDLPPLEDLGIAPPDEDTAPAAGGIKVVFAPDRELYESGNEPLFLIKALADLGDCRTSVALDAPTDADGLSTLGGRLTWTIEIDTEAQPSAVHEIFEFVDGLCKLQVEVLEGTTEAAAPLPDLAPPADTPAPAPAPVAEAPKPAPAPAAAPAAAPAPAKPANGEKAAKAATSAKASPTVRVDLERIERLVNLVGELVINQAMLSQSIAEENIPPNSPVTNGLDEFMQLTRNIQESVMMIRAQPVKSLFQRMSRIVRESSAAVGKSVKLVTDGETTEIDKTAIERLADPLTHMIRNAVDHGLEDAATRVERGKSEQGEIRLKAYHKSGRVLIEVSDDGGGINREKVKAKAIQNGLIPEDVTLTDTEIDQLLFLPGFSTANEVSNLSGRGVGMDVVKTQITSLGGRVTIESTPGVGTTFAISLPLTLAVLDGMVVTVASETLVIPLNAIVETLTLAVDDLKPVAAGQSVLCVRDQFVPVFDLGVELGYRDVAPVQEGTIALLLSPEEGVLVALLVDTIEDQRQVVIKGMQESYGRVPGVAAATILGDGQIALILDANDLVQNATGEDLVIKQKKVS
ncbi:MAG: chemotaxis protein CheA [Silicimonas sp.]|nr:chemotaxis protein CheA [Silicimonas sp.]